MVPYRWSYCSPAMARISSLLHINARTSSMYSFLRRGTSDVVPRAPPPFLNLSSFASISSFAFHGKERERERESEKMQRNDKRFFEVRDSLSVRSIGSRRFRSAIGHASGRENLFARGKIEVWHSGPQYLTHGSQSDYQIKV